MYPTGSVLLFFVIIVGIPVWLKHRLDVLKLQSKTRSADHDRLLEEIAELRARCENLEQQVVEVQMQLADEQRQLDRKLDAILPGVPEQGPTLSAAPRKDSKQVQRPSRDGVLQLF